MSCDSSCDEILSLGVVKSFVLYFGAMVFMNDCQLHLRRLHHRRTRDSTVNTHTVQERKPRLFEPTQDAVDRPRV